MEFGKVYSSKDRISFRPDFIVELSPDKQKELDCKYIWGERVLTSEMSPEKRFWLPKMLSKEWLIVMQGRKGWKAGWDALRPETYDKEPPEKKYEIFDLLQSLKYPNFFPLEHSNL